MRDFRFVGRCLLFAVSSLLLLAPGCGGLAVVDGQASAGGGGASTTTTSTSTSNTTSSTTITTGTTTTTTTPLTCEDLEVALRDAIARASRCNPTDPDVQCDGSAFVYDQCQCELLANENRPQAINEALAAFDTWVAAGCGPWLCQGCPVFAPGFCAGEPGNAHCVVAVY